MKYILTGLVSFNASVEVEANSLEEAVKKAEIEQEYELVDGWPKHANFEWDGDTDSVEAH